MKFVTRAAAAATVMMGAALALAGPSSADLLGPYVMNDDQSQRVLNGVLTPAPNSSATWSMGPCRDGCLVIHSDAGWSSYAYLNNGRWEFSRDTVWNCPDGRRLPLTLSYSFDEASMTGTTRGFAPAGCEGFPITADGVTFTLTDI